jgi:hypothetical protein
MMQMDILLNIVTGLAGGGIITFIFRNWITERLKQSIQHEYAQKLESHKSELNSKLQSISHEYQLHQLRTSLFFDHQRNAFEKTLLSLTKALLEWRETCDPEDGTLQPIPISAYKNVKQTFFNHKLFLDNDCVCAMELAIEIMNKSFPVNYGDGDLQPRDCNEPYDAFEYFLDRLPEIFQEKIGLIVTGRAKLDIALLGAIYLLNRYHFSQIDLPPKGVLRLVFGDTPADAVRKAEQNQNELIDKLNEFHKFLRHDMGHFHEATIQIERYIQMLSRFEFGFTKSK